MARSIVLLLLFFSLATPAYADSVGFGTAAIFWDSLQVRPDPTITLVFDRYTSRNVLRINDFYSDEQKSNWTESHVASHEIEGLNYSAHGLASNTGLSPQLFSEADVFASDLAGEFAAHATAQRWAYFHASGSGNITVEVDYRLTATLLSDLGDEVFGHSLAYVQVTNLAGFPATSTQNRQVPILQSIVRNGDSYFDSLEGRMSATLYFNDGDSGHFQVWAQSQYQVNSPIHVPEPSSVGFLIAGFAACGFIVIRLQRRGRESTHAERG